MQGYSLCSSADTSLPSAIIIRLILSALLAECAWLMPVAVVLPWSHDSVGASLRVLLYGRLKGVTCHEPGETGILIRRGLQEKLGIALINYLSRGYKSYSDWLNEVNIWFGPSADTRPTNQGKTRIMLPHLQWLFPRQTIK